MKTYTKEEVEYIKKFARSYGAADVIEYLKRNLGGDLKVNSSLKTKEAYAFANLYVKLLEQKFLGQDK